MRYYAQDMLDEMGFLGVGGYILNIVFLWFLLRIVIAWTFLEPEDMCHRGFQYALFETVRHS